MNIRRNILRTLSFAAVLGFVTAAAPAQHHHASAATKATIGKAAPDFKLKDVDGTSYKLSDFKGKTVVLQWINPGCPYCVRVMSKGVVKSMHDEIGKIDTKVVFLAIDSTNAMDLKKSAAYMKQHKIGMPVLDDHKGKVGRLYGARTTPQMFVIDKEGILRYDGAIDDDARGKNPGKAANYVVTAVRQITTGETVTPDKVKSYGCSVKYKK